MVENETISWSKNKLLTLSDFKAESNHAVFEDSHSVIKYRYTWTVNSEKVNDEILFFIENIQLFVEFHPLLSWIRSSNNSEILLTHEQGHFDLAEMIKRESISSIENLLYGQKFPTRGSNEEQRKQFAKEDSNKMLFDQVETLTLEFDKKRKEYDLITNFGTILEQQKKYDLMFEKLHE